MQDSSITLPSLHDWEIVKVNIDRFSDEVIIGFHEPTSNEFVDLQLGSVGGIYLSGMTKQNVVLDVMIFSEPEDSDYYIRCCKLLKVTSPFTNKDGVIDKNMKVLYIEPSVGAELACRFITMKYTKTLSHTQHQLVLDMRPPQ